MRISLLLALLLLLLPLACKQKSGGDGQVPEVCPAGDPDLSGCTPSAAFVSVALDPVSGAAAVVVDVFHSRSIPVDLLVEVTFEAGRIWRTATLATSPVWLAASPDGVRHTLIWDFRADTGIHLPLGGALRLTPRSKTFTGGLVESPALDAAFMDAAAAAAGAALRARVATIRTHAFHYGPLDPAVIAQLETFDLVVIHPSNAIATRADVLAIQDGVDPDAIGDDVVVLSYLSIGEDSRTFGLTNAQMLADARFLGDGTAAGSGPRVDPRGPNSDGQSLAGVIGQEKGQLSPLADPVARPFATYYLDDNSVDAADPGEYGDGFPDGNPAFQTRFVNAGDPAWYDVLRDAVISSGQAGLRELLEPGFGAAFLSDGVFLDTVDTCAPNSYTDGTSFIQSEFEWTAPGFTDFMDRVKLDHPHQLVFQNRGVFFFDPFLPHFEHHPGTAIDLLLFESYRLNSSSVEDFSATFFADNKFNHLPHVMAEAGRPNGFRVLSLGYAEGPTWGAGAAATLSGRDPCTGAALATPRCAELVTDLFEAERVAGFRHYLTDASLTLVNGFARTHAVTADTDPPSPTSTWNDSGVFPPLAATPRIGIQEAVSGPAGGPTTVLVRWDLALDYGRVRYALYHQTVPFDFGADPSLSGATRVVLQPSVGLGYELGPGPGLYPYQAEVTLPAGTHYFVIRAFDDASPPNEEQNQNTLSASAL